MQEVHCTSFIYFYRNTITDIYSILEASHKYKCLYVYEMIVILTAKECNQCFLMEHRNNKTRKLNVDTVLNLLYI